MTDTENEIQPAAVPVESGGESVPVATISPMPSALTDEPKQAPTAAPEEPKATENGKALVEAKKISEPVSNGHDFNDAANVAEAEGQQKKLPYPKSVFFIISNEFCERFNYYGMRTVLVLFLSYQLGYSNDTATVVFHIFTMFVYFLCVFGAIISDSWLGKFKTILNLSLVYICGSVLLTLGAIGPLNLPVETFTMIGLALIALGSGGIKPCVSAFGGDQFKMPEQVKQITTFFSLFYFSINAGSLISTSVTPILREDVHCFGEKECYPLAFGVPAVLMIVSVIIIVLGRPLYKIKPPAGNMVVLVSKTIWTALRTKCKEKKTNPREHWLDYADQKYDRQLIDDVKVLMRVLFLYLPLPVFWALFDQQGSRWTFQATRMDGDMGSWDIKPDQLQVLNPLLILVFIPLYDVAFYPALRLVGISRPLQKLTMGGVLAGIAFIISGVVELNLERTYPVIASTGNTQFRVFSGTPGCHYQFRSNLLGSGSNFTLQGIDFFYSGIVATSNGSFTLDYSIESLTAGCTRLNGGTQILKEAKAHTLFLRPNHTVANFWYEDEVQKSNKSKALVRTLANTPATTRIVWRETKSGYTALDEPARNHDLYELSTMEYDVLVSEVLVHQQFLRHGGVYALVIGGSSDRLVSRMFEVTTPNSMSILWLTPQYVVMTLAEVMFSVTGLEFSYAQAPPSMKSVLQACWLLTVAFGNVIVVVVAELKFFQSQANEFFLFAGLMFVDMLVFMWIAYYYIPNDEKVPSTELVTEHLEMLKGSSSCNNGESERATGSTESSQSYYDAQPSHWPRYRRYDEVD
ncbi:peptide transporter family 1 isoform X1 [Scaptodrosophila lebanonensis]|uniref:Oligopeptide transporter 1 n=1 Tax=Drosophila lebanonensis TaxID=7225 RepID=A0A6J2TWS2_DROLE|nr:peptide transporter family 1 isoform X1 [Scaptodrosophila lebanonensis]XP_030380982.1 peptide transporter family 1 isoform X1 [Scaptodrosophila lebanonensis]